MKDPGRVKLYESEGGSDDRELIGEFKGLTDTRESYSEHEASHFDVVLEDSDDEEDDVDAGDVRKDEHIRTAILASEKRGMSYPDAADLVPYGDTWVGDRVREWKKGDHRDLVSEDDVAAGGGS